MPLTGLEGPSRMYLQWIRTFEMPDNAIYAYIYQGLEFVKVPQ